MAASAGGQREVGAFMASLDHLLKAEVSALRDIVLAADPRVGEHIKWNAPSFVLDDDFATFNLRKPDAIQIIFHGGAKARSDGPRATTIADPSKLLKWAAADRAVATFKDMDQVDCERTALTAIVRAWVAQL